MIVPHFWLTVVCVNWGRGYDPGEFKANVLNVLEFTEGREHVVILAQEIDEEPDPANERRRFRTMLEPGTHRIGWQTREPIVLSPPFDVRRERAVMTMDQGGAIGAPKGTGPRRFAVSCIGGVDGLEVGFGNTHPHRRMSHPKVVGARARGRVVFKQQMTSLYRARTAGGAHLELLSTGHLNGTIDPHDPLWARFHVTPGRGLPVIWGADQNDPDYPRVLPNERTAIHRGLDYIRYANHPRRTP